MMRSIHYLKKVNLLLIFLIAIIFNSCSSAHNYEVNNQKAIILRVGFKNQDNKIWELNYIIINKIVYSGDIFIGNNFSCIKNLSPKLLESISKYGYSEKIELMDQKLNAIKYSWLQVRDPSIDSMFMVKSVSIPIKYLKLDCNVSTPDYFSFLYTQEYNGLQLLDVEYKKLRVVQTPKWIRTRLKSNSKCLQKLNISYKEFTNCLMTSRGIDSLKGL